MILMQMISARQIIFANTSCIVVTIRIPMCFTNGIECLKCGQPTQIYLQLSINILEIFNKTAHLFPNSADASLRCTNQLD